MHLFPLMHLLKSTSLWTGICYYNNAKLVEKKKRHPILFNYNITVKCKKFNPMGINPLEIIRTQVFKWLCVLWGVSYRFFNQMKQHSIMFHISSNYRYHNITFDVMLFNIKNTIEEKVAVFVQSSICHISVPIFHHMHFSAFSLTFSTIKIWL